MASNRVLPGSKACPIGFLISIMLIEVDSAKRVVRVAQVASRALKKYGASNYGCHMQSSRLIGFKFIRSIARSIVRYGFASLGYSWLHIVKSSSRFL